MWIRPDDLWVASDSAKHLLGGVQEAVTSMGATDDTVGDLKQVGLLTSA